MTLPLILTSPRKGHVIITNIDKEKIKYNHKSSAFIIYIDFIIETYKYFYGHKHISIKDIAYFRNHVYKGKQSTAHCNYMFFIILMSEIFGIPIHKGTGRGAPVYIDL